MAQRVLARNNVQVLGRGQPMLFAPGFGCDQTMWRFVAPAFAERHQVVLLDYVGAGQSDWRAYDPERYDDLRGYAQDLREICDALGLEEIVLVGHSIGGLIGLIASLDQPGRFSNLILIGSSARYIDDPPDYVGGFDRSAVDELLDLMERNESGWASFLAPLVMKNAGRPELARELEASFRAVDPRIARQFAALTFYSDHRALLPHVTAPSLILQCLEDLIVPQAAATYLHQHLPQSTLRTLSAVGHYPHLSNPGQTVKLIAAYLQAQPAG